MCLPRGEQSGHEVEQSGFSGTVFSEQQMYAGAYLSRGGVNGQFFALFVAVCEIVKCQHIMNVYQ